MSAGRGTENGVGRLTTDTTHSCLQPRQGASLGSVTSLLLNPICAISADLTQIPVQHLLCILIWALGLECLCALI